MLARLQRQVEAMGLGVFLFFVLCCVIGGGVWVIAAIEKAKGRHRQEMEDFVRGRTGRRAEQPTSDAPQFGGVAGAFTTAAPPSKKPTSGADEAAMLRGAKRLYEETLAEVRNDNREYRARQPGRCTLQITYVDMDGVITIRKVAPYRSGNTNQKFDAWCETRQDRRTFFFNSVQGGVDLNTGLRLDRSDVFRRIHPGRRVPAEFR